MRYDTVIFDLDGTLLDTLGDLTCAVCSALSRFSFPVLSLEEVRARIGDGLRVLMERCFPKGTEDRIITEAMEHFCLYQREHLLDNTLPYAGIEKTLDRLKTAGVRLCVATNKEQFLAEKLMDTFFPNTFHAVCGRCDGRRRKPAPDIPMAALSAVENPERVLFVGDYITDRRTAEECGFDFLGVDWGYGDSSMLTPIVNNTEELIEFILV